MKSWRRQALFKGRHCFCPTPTLGGGSSQGGRHPLTALSTVPTQYQTTRNASSREGRTSAIPSQNLSLAQPADTGALNTTAPGFEPTASGSQVYRTTARVPTRCGNTLLRDRMEMLLTNIFPQKAQPTLGLPPRGGGDSAEGTQNLQKGRQATPPPLGEGVQATKKRLDQYLSH